MIGQYFAISQYTLNALAIQSLTVSLAVLVLGIYAVSRERASRVSVAFLVLTMTVSMWLFSFSWMYSATSEQIAWWWAKAAYIGVALIPAAAYHYSVLVLQDDRKYRKWVSYVWIASCVFLTLILTTNMLFSSLYRYWWGYYPKYNMTSIPYLLYFFGMMIAVVRRSWMGYRRSPEGSAQMMQTRAVLITISVGCLGCVDYFAAYGIPVYPFGYIPILSFIVLSARSIVLYRLLAITPAIAAPQIIETMNDALIVLDRDGVVRLVNQATCNLLGSREQDLLGRQFSRIEGISFARELESIVHGAAVRNVELDYRPEADAVRSLSVSTSIMRDRIGEPLAFVCVLRDITERKQAELRLCESEVSYRDLFDSITDAIHILDAEGRFLDVNKGAELMYGYPHDFFIGKTPEALSAPDMNNMPATFESLQRAYAGEPQRIDFWGRRSDGEVFPKDVSLMPATYKGQRAVIAVSRNIAERKRAEEKLRTSEVQLSNAMKIARMGHWEYDVAGDLFTFNDPFYTMLRTTAELAGGYTMSSADYAKRFVHPDDVPVVAAEIEKALAAADRNYNRQIEHRIVYGDSTTGYMSVRIFILKDEQGCTVKTYGVNQDITELKQAEKQRFEMEQRLQQVQKLESLGVLAGGIAHDFNNLLMAILGHAQLAQMELPSQAPVQDNLKKIESASHRAADLCRQMLAYSGRGQFASERVDLGELVEEMTYLLKTSINKKAVLNLNLQAGLPPIEADAGQIRQIVMNLIINASEALGDRSGVITVATGAVDCDQDCLKRMWPDSVVTAGPCVYIEVSDTGCGMDKKTQQRIFEPFFTTKFMGRGLGLSAVLGIIRAHKGGFSIDSEPGMGSTFKIFFPALPLQAETLQATSEKHVSTRRCRGTVLLVDDEELVRTVCEKMLAALGYDVIAAADGREALDIYRERGGSIDLVLLDMTMPHLDGAETFRELRLLDPEAHVIVSSGYSEHDVTSQFVGKGLAGFIHKPYTMDGLRTALSRVL